MSQTELPSLSPRLQSTSCIRKNASSLIAYTVGDFQLTSVAELAIDADVDADDVPTPGFLDVQELEESEERCDLAEQTLAKFRARGRGASAIRGVSPVCTDTRRRLDLRLVLSDRVKGS